MGWFRKWYSHLGLIAQLRFDAFRLTWGSAASLMASLGDTIVVLHSHLNDGLHNLWYGAHQVWAGNRRFGYETAITFWWLAHRSLPRIRTRVEWLRTWTVQAIKEDRATIRRVYLFLLATILSRIAGVIAWATAHILVPLIQLSLRLGWYIVNRINPLWTFWQLFRSLDWSIAKLIAAMFEKYAWDLGGILGKFLLTLIYRNAMRFLVLVEDIVDAVL